jgi:hypothetical protein
MPEKATRALPPSGVRLFLVTAALALTACGGSESGAEGESGMSPAIGFEPIKTFSFTWSADEDADHYRLMENPDGQSGYTQVGADIPVGTESASTVVPLHKRSSARYVIASCDNAGCEDSKVIAVDDPFVDAIGYIKASNAGAGDHFGGSEGVLGGSDSLSRGVVKLSQDGTTLAVGAAYEDSGVAGDGTDDSASAAGAVYVFTRNGSDWQQQAYLKASTIGADDRFGGSLALSDDGSTLAVGAPFEDSNGQSINPGSATEADDSVADSGAVYVFTRDGSGNWSQQAYIKAGDINDNDYLGADVSLSADGDRLVAGAPGKGYYGFVYTFNRDGSGNWSEDAASLVPPGPGGDAFGRAVSVSGDGNTLAVGQETPQNSIRNYGRVHIYTRSSGSWTAAADFTAANNDAYDQFANDVDLSHDGRTLAVGAYGEASNGIGVDSGAEANNDADDAGAVYVYTSSDGTNWSEDAYIKASNTAGADRFGISLDLSDDGDYLVVGARREESDGAGVNPGDQDTNGTNGSGAAYLFRQASGSWSQVGFLKASNPDAWDQFGFAVGLSGDTDTIAVGANKEDSAGTGVDSPDVDDNSASAAGAVYLY